MNIETSYRELAHCNSYGEFLRHIMDEKNISIVKLSHITAIPCETIRRLRDNKPCGRIVDYTFTICTALKLRPSILEMLLRLGTPGHQFSYEEQIRRYECLLAR